MDSKLILIVLLGVATVASQRFGPDPFAYLRRFHRKLHIGKGEPSKPFPTGLSGAPSLAQARQFINSNRAAKEALADFEAHLPAIPQQEYSGCGCTQETCQERTDQTLVIFDMGQPCVIFSPPGGVSVTTCTAETNGTTCPEFFGCGTGTCQTYGAMDVPVFGVCIISTPPFFRTLNRTETVTTGCCCL